MIRKRFLRAVACVTALFLSLFFSGCVSADLSVLPPSEPVVRLSVPFTPQEEFQCGPAVMDMVLRHYGVQVPFETLIKEVYTPSLSGSLQASLLSAGRRHGMLAYPLSGVQAVVDEVRSGRPVILLQNLGLSWYPKWHYSVMVGYDRGSGEAMLHTGVYENRPVGFGTLQKTFERGGSWGLLLLPAGQLPVSYSVTELVSTLSAMERGGKQSLTPRWYEAALKQHPQDATLLTAYANNRYATKDFSRAEELYRLALESDGAFVPALNNVASLLMEKGELDSAQYYAEKAVSNAAGTHYLTVAEETLRDIIIRKNQISH